MRITILLLFFLTSCSNEKVSKDAGAEGWLKGRPDEKFETIAGQLRGLDMAMFEVGYRYQELYWAGRDENWDYANYQLEKIKLAIDNGLVRRPKRAKSAEEFLHSVLPEMKKAVDKKDTVFFNQYFQTLTNTCNSCHKLEKVPFFSVKIPALRQSPIRK